MPAESLRLPASLIDPARIASQTTQRSIPKQIEHWAMIGRIAEENPDMTYQEISNLLLAEAEFQNGETEAFVFQDKKRAEAV